MWRGRSEKVNRDDGSLGAGGGGERRARRIDGAEHLASATFDAARSRAPRNPLDSGYAVDGIDLPDPGRPVRRLNLPPLGPGANQVGAGSAGVDQSVAPSLSDAGNGSGGRSMPERWVGPAASSSESPNASANGASVGAGDSSGPESRSADRLAERHPDATSRPPIDLGVFTGAVDPSEVIIDRGVIEADPHPGLSVVPDGTIDPQTGPSDEAETRNGKLTAVPDLPGNADYRSERVPSPQYLDRTAPTRPDYGQDPASTWGSNGADVMDSTRQWPADDGFGRQDAYGSNVFGAPGDGDPGPYGESLRDPLATGEPPKLRLAASRQPSKPKPKRASGWLLGFGLIAVLAAGAAAAYWLTRGDDTTSDVATGADAETVANADTEQEAAPDATASTAAADTATSDTTPASPTGEPLLVMPAAEEGPLTTETAFPIEILSAPAGVQYQIVVDDIPQGNPYVVLPDLHLPAGYHTIYVEMIDGANRTPTNTIDVHVFDNTQVPATGYRANLASINVETEGWSEAVSRFNQYKAAGHENLRMTPSDPYPSLVPGYYNIYVDGFGEDRAGAQKYCEDFNLAIPDECFPSYFDPEATS